jgi:hypothetical protein
MGCTTSSVSTENGNLQADETVLLDKMEANMEAFFYAAAANRNALQEEANICVPTTSARVLTNRNRVINHPVTIRQALLQTHRPVAKNLIHHSIIQLVAFPKEYHIFQLRRILI